MTIYIRAIDKKLLAHAWIEATRLYGAIRDESWMEKYNAIYEQMWEGSYDYEQERRFIQSLSKLSLSELKRPQDFVLVSDDDERLIEARSRLEYIDEEQPNFDYASYIRDVEENRDLDLLDTD